MIKCAITLTLILLAAACGSDVSRGGESPAPEGVAIGSGADDSDFSVPAGEEELGATWLHRERTAPSRPPGSTTDPVAHLATNQAELEGAWETYRIEEDLPEADWSSHSVLLMGVVESGNCPYQPVGATRDDEDRVTVYLDLDVESSDDDFTCNSDDNPTTLVLAIEKDALPSEPALRFEHDRWERVLFNSDSGIAIQEPELLEDVEYPFDVWRSSELPKSTDSPRVIDRAEVIANDEQTLTLRFGFSDPQQVPIASSGQGYEVYIQRTDEDDDSPIWQLGLIVHEAESGVPPPRGALVYAGPHGEVAFPGKDYHPMMGSAVIYGGHSSSAGEEDPAMIVDISPVGGNVEWSVRNSGDGEWLELEIRGDS